MTHEEIQAMRKKYENVWMTDNLIGVVEVSAKVGELLDEIERLRGALNRIKEDIDYLDRDSTGMEDAIYEIAHKALEGDMK